MRFKRTVKCICTYVEDGIEYWSEGHTYGAVKHRDGNWSIKTNKGTIGGIGPSFVIDDFDAYFVETPAKTA